jgi:hypothetical protein
VADRIPPDRLPSGGEPTVIRTRGGAVPGALRPGTVLGHTYAVAELLGRGSLGEVYRARHVELGTAHAIKLIQPALASDPKTVQLLVEEARRLARVRHDAIVDYEGLFRDEQGLRYLVMEFVEGPTLASVIATRRLEPDEVLALRDRLADGLASVHARGIIHRDLSPDTIILPDGEPGRAKLIGFGFAKSADVGDATLIGVNLMARHAYASPEQLGLFGGRIDSRSDLYSLGLVLAAAAIGFGKTLDMGATPATAIAARQRAPDLSPVPAALRPVIAPLLAPRPDDRPASVRAMPGLDRGRAAPLSPSGKLQALGLRRSFWLIAAVGASAMLLLAGVVLMALRLAGPIGSPTPDELRMRLAAATAGFECASLGYTLLPDRSVRLSGHVASAEDLTQLRRAVAAIPGIGQPGFAVQVMGRPHCDVVALLTPLAEPASRDGLGLAFAGGANGIHIGERPSFDIRAPDFDSYLYVDYFDSGGQVLHLFPNARDRFNLRPWRNHLALFKSPLWTVCGNVGRQLVTVIAAERPLFPGRRPEIEDAGAYIASLGEAIRAASRGKIAASLLFFDLREAPPWINRELACPSG